MARTRRFTIDLRVMRRPMVLRDRATFLRDGTARYLANREGIGSDNPWFLYL